MIREYCVSRLELKNLLDKKCLIVDFEAVRQLCPLCKTAQTGSCSWNLGPTLLVPESLTSIHGAPVRESMDPTAADDIAVISPVDTVLEYYRDMHRMCCGKASERVWREAV